MDDLTAVSSATRGRSGTIIPIPIPDEHPNEIFNTPSGRRRALLNELGEVLQTKNIPVPFWAGLQVCDIDILEKMVEKARVAPEFVWVVARYSCRHLPLLWLQKPPKGKGSSAPTSTSTSSAASSFDRDGRPKKKSRREYRPVELARKRENQGCFLNRTEPIEVAHIYPNYLIHPRAEDAKRPFEFWDLLKIFWGAEKLASWQAELYRNPENPTKAADTIKNLICMGPEIHKMWSNAHCALRPLGYNGQKTELALEWHWLPKEHHNFDNEVDITKVPSPTMGLDCTAGQHNHVRVLIKTPPEAPRGLKTGDRILMMTPDPDNLPLPSHELLDLQFHLQRLSSMAAAADVDDEYEDDQHQPMADAQRVEEWLDSLDGQNSVQTKLERQKASPSSSRSRVTDTNTSDNPNFSSTVSSVPSPHKTRQQAMHSLSVEEPPYLLEPTNEG